MRSKIIASWIVAMACFAVTAVRAQRLALPDLTVSEAVLIPDVSGQFAQKIAVTVKNTCRALANDSYVLITIKATSDRDAKPLYFTGGPVKALKGGESSTHVFDLSDRKIAYGSFVFIEADPYKRVSEADEENNWRTLFPSGAGAPNSGAKCSR